MFRTHATAQLMQWYALESYVPSRERDMKLSTSKIKITCTKTNISETRMRLKNHRSMHWWWCCKTFFRNHQYLSKWRLPQAYPKPSWLGAYWLKRSFADKRSGVSGTSSWVRASNVPLQQRSPTAFWSALASPADREVIYLSSGETTSGVLGPVLRFSVQHRHGHTGMTPAMGHEDE